MAAVLFVVLVLERAGMKLLRGVPLGQLPGRLIPPALLWGLAALIFVPGFLLAERAAISSGRVRPYTFVVLAGCALVAALFFPSLDWLGFPWRAQSFPGAPQPQFSVFLALLLTMGLVAFIYAGHRERLDAAHVVQALETRRNETMRRLAVSRLEAARARVQPEAFIVELRGLRGTYVENLEMAGAGLEALIVRLRAASRSADL
jgi:hypothetical protein